MQTTPFKRKGFCEQAACHTLGFIQNMGYPKETVLTEIAGWAGGGGLLELLREICRRSRRRDDPSPRRHRRDFLSIFVL